MAYIAVTDLFSRFGVEELAQLSDRGVPRTVTPELLSAAAAGADMSAWSATDVEAVSQALATISQAIADACSAIDGYLAGRYGVPLADPPPAVRRMACDMARYFLYDDGATEIVEKRYTGAIAYFRDVSSGKVTLGPVVESAPAAGGLVEMVSATPVFGRRERGM